MFYKMLVAYVIKYNEFDTKNPSMSVIRSNCWRKWGTNHSKARGKSKYYLTSNLKNIENTIRLTNKTFKWHFLWCWQYKDRRYPVAKEHHIDDLINFYSESLNLHNEELRVECLVTFSYLVVNDALPIPTKFLSCANVNHVSLWGMLVAMTEPFFPYLYIHASFFITSNNAANKAFVEAICSSIIYVQNQQKFSNVGICSFHSKL